MLTLAGRLIARIGLAIGAGAIFGQASGPNSPVEEHTDALDHPSGPRPTQAHPAQSRRRRPAPHGGTIRLGRAYGSEGLASRSPRRSNITPRRMRPAPTGTRASTIRPRQGRFRFQPHLEPVRIACHSCQSPHHSARATSSLTGSSTRLAVCSHSRPARSGVPDLEWLVYRPGQRGSRVRMLLAIARIVRRRPGVPTSRRGC